MLHPARPITDALTWLAGAEPQLLRHAYPDQTRFVSLGLSVAVAAAVAATSVGLGLGTVAWPWLGWLSFPVLLAGCCFGLRHGFSWVWSGLPARFSRRLLLLALGLAISAILLAWPVRYYLLGSVTSQSSVAFIWAIHLTLLLIVLVPAYVAASLGRSCYARILGTRHSFYSSFRY